MYYMKVVYKRNNVRGWQFQREHQKGGGMDNLQEISGKIIPGFQAIFENVLERVILYGSFARGTQTEESDIDIAVIVQSYTEDMHDRMIDFTVDIELEYDRVLSVLLIDYDSFKEWEDVLPFYKNIKKDGIILWGTA